MNTVKEAGRRLSLINDSRADLELGLVDKELVELRKTLKKYKDRASKLEKLQKRRLTNNRLTVEQSNQSKQLEKMGEFAAWFCVAFVIFVCILAEIELHGTK